MLITKNKNKLYVVLLDEPEYSSGILDKYPFSLLLSVLSFKVPMRLLHLPTLKYFPSLTTYLPMPGFSG